MFPRVAGTWLCVLGLIITSDTFHKEQTMADNMADMGARMGERTLLPGPDAQLGHTDLQSWLKP